MVQNSARKAMHEAGVAIVPGTQLLVKLVMIMLDLVLQHQEIIFLKHLENIKKMLSK